MNLMIDGARKPRGNFSIHTDGPPIKCDHCEKDGEKVAVAYIVCKDHEALYDDL